MLAVAVLAAAATPVYGQCSLHELTKLIASDSAANDEFAYSIAVSGETAVVGAHWDDNAGGSNAGSAYVFTRDGGVWSQQAKLIAVDAAANDEFGYSVALSGDTAVVGARYDDHTGGTDAGSAYVFTRVGGVWSQQAKLVGSNIATNDNFGNCVAISGETAVVGAVLDDHSGGTNAGSAYVFVRTSGIWTQQAKLAASDAVTGDLFGVSAAVSGETVVVGAHWDDNAGGSNAGSAYVFTRDGGVWSQQAKLIAVDAAANDEFGYSVALSGDTAVVGARYDDHTGGTDAGSAYVFTRVGGMWSQQAKLVASDAAVNDQFGWSVAASGDTTVVGAYQDDHAGEFNAGSGYIFNRFGIDWTERAKLTASDAVANDLFANSVAVSDNIAAVGAWRDDHAGGVDAGSAYIFDLSDYDADGVPNVSDSCPYTVGGCAVDVLGRPLFDRNDDCIVNGLDIQIIVDEIMLGAGLDIDAAVDNLLTTCSPCS